MNNITILLSVTFVFGVLKLLTHTRLFDTTIDYPIAALLGIKNKKKTYIGSICVIIDVWFFHFSLAVQAWFWLFK